MKPLKKSVIAGCMFVTSMFGTSAEADPPVLSCYDVTYGCGGTVEFLGCGYGTQGNLCVYCCDQNCYYCT